MALNMHPLDVGSLLGVGNSAMAIMAGLPPSSYEKCVKLIEEFALGVIELTEYGFVGDLDVNSNKNLEEFISGGFGSRISVIGENFRMTAVRRWSPAIIVTEIIIEA
jgi:hypothetical protein